MLHKTKGIIIHTLPYNDNRFIVKIYTQTKGLQSYVISGTRSKKSSHKKNYLQPLTMVDLVISSSGKSKLESIKEINVNYIYTKLSTDIIKGSIAIFISEILLKTLHDDNVDEDLFEFAETSLKLLDIYNENCENFHLVFLVQLSKLMGFSPKNNFSQHNVYFDLQEGVYKPHIPAHSYFLSFPSSEIFYKISNTSFNELNLLSLSNNDRSIALNALILYFQLHVESMKNIKSIDILHQLFT